MKSLLSLTLITSLFWNTLAMAEVRTISDKKTGNTLVVEEKGERVFIKECNSQNDCIAFGNPDGYLESDLLSEKQSEYLKSAGLTVAALVTIGLSVKYALAKGTAAGVSGTSLGRALETAMYSIAGAIGGTAIVGIATRLIDKISPLQRFKSARSLGKITDGENHMVRNLGEVKEQLTTSLHRIDESSRNMQKNIARTIAEEKKQIADSSK